METDVSEPRVSLVVLIDFDGTIARSDVSDEVMRRYASASDWAPLEAAYLQGVIGSRTLLSRQAALLDARIEEIAAIGDDQAIDPHFAPFVAFLREHAVPIEIVSDGFGFFVGPVLERAGVGDLPVFTARTTFTPNGVEIRFPAGHPTCRVCGTCKRERILIHQRAGRYVVFIGDGFSDLYAASYADLVFAKDHLAQICHDRRLPFRSWTDFADIQTAVSDIISTGIPAARSRPFICGPEVWPPGTTEPLWDTPASEPSTAL